MRHGSRLRLLDLEGNLRVLAQMARAVGHLCLLMGRGGLRRHLRLLLVSVSLRHHHALLRGHGLVGRGSVLCVGRMLRGGLHGRIVGLMRLVVHILRREVLRRRLAIDAAVLIMLRRRGDGSGRVRLRGVI